MKKFLIAIVSLIAASAISWQLLGLYWKYEYGQKAPKVSLTVSEVSRHYYLFVPDNLTEPAPLVLAFHGGGGGGWRFPQQFLFEELAAAEGAVLHPDSVRSFPWTPSPLATIHLIPGGGGGTGGTSSRTRSDNPPP